MLYLRDDFAKLWAGRDPFEAVDEIDGLVYREVGSRRTLQFQCRGGSFFLKSHKGIGWKEILKNLSQFRLPVVGAETEWRAVRRLEHLGIDTMTAVAYGRRGLNPAKVESFLITEDLRDTVSLEDHCADWAVNAPQLSHKVALIRKVAEIARLLHNNGVCHRDFYLCHFLLRGTTADGEPKLFVIDLHRALIRKALPQRWILKDLAGLYYSALHIGLTRRDLYRFMRTYSGKPLGQALKDNARFWSRVERKALRLDSKVKARDGLG